MSEEDIRSIAARPVELGAPEFSDEEVALTFASRHREHLRYVDQRGGGSWSDGCKWEEPEPTRLAQDLAHHTRPHLRPPALADPNQSPAPPRPPPTAIAPLPPPRLSPP